MATKIELFAETRNESGKRASRRLRHTNKVLATVYGAGKEPANVSMEHHKVSKALENEAFYSSILTLTIGGQPEKVVIKAIQRHPSKPKVLHMDFYRINPKEKLNMQVPLHFLGETASPGVKAGGVISHLMTDVEIRCLPDNLPEFIEVDLSGLELDKKVHLSDLKLATTLELVAFLHGGNIEENDQVIAHAHMPHIHEEPVETEVVAPSPEVQATRVASDKERAEADAAAKETGGKEAKKDKG
jgi:large subunit ribosomal protein L25